MLEIIKVSGNVSYLLNWVIVEQAHRQQAVKGHLPATVQAISKFEVPPMTGTSITWARKHCRARTAASPPPPSSSRVCQGVGALGYSDGTQTAMTSFGE